jgi:hypothetical protein
MFSGQPNCRYNKKKSRTKSGMNESEINLEELTAAAAIEKH